jgi:hypothetical protein
MELTFFAGLFWSVIFAIVLPGAILVGVGYGVSRWAHRLAARQRHTGYPTEQVLAETWQEPPEQWPPAPEVDTPEA